MVYVTPKAEEYLLKNIFENKKKGGGIIKYVDNGLVEEFGEIIKSAYPKPDDILTEKDKSKINKITSDWKAEEFGKLLGPVGGNKQNLICLFGGHYGYTGGKSILKYARHPGDNNIGILVVEKEKEKVNNVDYNDMLYKADGADEYIKGCKDINKIAFKPVPNDFFGQLR